MKTNNQRYVYFVRDENWEHVKVGISTNPKDRLSGIRAGNWIKLYLLKVIPGDLKLERQIQADLKRFPQMEVTPP